MKTISGITVIAYIIAGLVAIFQTVRVASFIHSDISDALSGFAFAILIAGIGYLYNRVCSNDTDIKAIEDYLDDSSVKELKGETK